MNDKQSNTTADEKDAGRLWDIAATLARHDFDESADYLRRLAQSIAALHAENAALREERNALHAITVSLKTPRCACGHQMSKAENGYLCHECDSQGVAKIADLEGTITELRGQKEALLNALEKAKLGNSCVASERDKAETALAVSEKQNQPVNEPMQFQKKPDVMFAIYANQPGTDMGWFRQETSEDEASVRYWCRRNNENAAERHEPPRIYVMVKQTTTYELVNGQPSEPTDSEILDWLDKHCLRVEIDTGSLCGENIRAAIRHAMTRKG